MVLIDMDMPDSCARCKFLRFAPCNQEFRCMITDEAFFLPEAINIGRRGDCPLRECKENKCEKK